MGSSQKKIRIDSKKTLKKRPTQQSNKYKEVVADVQKTDRNVQKRLSDKVRREKVQKDDEVRSLTMRVGRKPRKTLVEQEKTKPCFVRLEKVGKEKIASLSSLERKPVNRKLIGPLKKRLVNSTSQVLKKEQTPNRSTQSLVGNKIQERADHTPAQGVKKVPEFSPSTSSKVLKRHPGRPSKTHIQIVKKGQNTPGSVVKKEEGRERNIKLSAAVQKALQLALNTTSPPVEKVLQRPLSTPSPAVKKVPQRPLNSQFFKKGEQSLPNKFSHIVKKVQGPSVTVASTRTRRAPKPNPKYSNADIITPKAKAKRTKGNVAYEDTDINESDEDFYNDLDETSVESESNDDVDADDAFMIEGDSSDFSENDDIRPKRPLRGTPQSFNNSPGSGSKRGRPKKKYSPPPVVRALPKAKVEPRKLIQQTLPQRTAPSVVQQQQQTKKRKLEEIDNEVDPVESIIARNKRLNIALYDANDAKPLSVVKSDTPRVVRTLVKPRNQSPAASSLLNQKRVFQGLNAIKSNQTSVTKETQKETIKSPQTPRRSPAAAVKYIESVDSASTQDDFETMPTFTIVNIHDIINKKGDCLIQKNTDEEKGTTSPNTTNKVNRRKSGHTTILSEKIDPVKLRNPIPRTPFPPKKPISTILNNNPPPRPEPKVQTRVTISPPEKKPVQAVVEKPAPRILNSVVAKRTYPVRPILGKLDNDVQLEPTDDPIEKTQMVKENVGANKLIPIKPVQPRKLPPEKVFVQRQGNKLIKKITCFETWYVINIPETQEPVVKNQLDIPLITLANAVKSIRLPSTAWSTKVTVYKLSTQLTSKTPMIPFIGDLSDQSISEQDREKYQPSCVMFRRMTQKKSKTRMPYDRAVIFKMKTFFTNIDGKNVKLIGAPSTVKSFEDIEILLELIDELDLVHEFVEPANTV